MNKFITLACAAALLAGCGKTDDKVVAKIGSDKITESYLQEKIAEINPAAAEYLATKPGKRQLLDVIIHERLMLLAARKSGMSSDADYKAQVAQKRAEMEANFTAFKDFTLTKLWIENMREGKLKVTEAEVADYYRQHPHKVTLAHILLSSNEEAEGVYKRLKAGADFDKTARQVSLDKDSVRLPPIMYGEFLPELEDMAFKMRVGETQGIVRTALGLHIIKKLSQETMNEEEAKLRIRKILEKKKFDDYLAKFQEKTKVEVLDEQYK